ncbi:NADP-dependent 3-hydroxy acid dehydrogenase YdfG [Pedobacter psychrotolerans]|uniref:NADP-dependent 3-hydroxy acid dehydrogenase YdfG n=1 Tax=Pedobacter psychrotolerans TaxID=1843235 RepID=A0A4R2HBP6_9SPHI|nr:SDR family NAD(P)-dependent oxidoreductase [Pedobacter psychrotolerans]TCO22687.1 NADP-dependent 3-hydroxy acid dehydrogenase YdfG [Pedobacter psychrotolerans]GGE66391.1 putative oxidoreductase [Pedobacter psychrotolerans]
MENRIAIITGASSGIGEATAIRLAKQGIKMILTGRNEKELNRVEDRINDKEHVKMCYTISGDISDPKTIDSCIAKCINVWQQPPNVFLAAAGRGLPGTLLSSDSDQWNDLINTNINALFYQLKSISRVMLKQASSKKFVNFPSDIIVIGSTVGRNVSPFNSVYGATKFAAHGLTEALRRELSVQGIRVTLIEPGLVKTNFQKTAGYDQNWFDKYAEEVGPVLDGDDVAKVIEFLIDLPGNVHMDNISIRPTRQSYP